MPTQLNHWKSAQLPSAQVLTGRFIRLEKLNPTHHGDDLWDALQGPNTDPKLWDYLPYGPFPLRHEFNDWLDIQAKGSDPYFFAIIDQTSGEAQGLISLLSIVPEQGRIEIGHVAFGASMQRSPKSTEAVYLLAKESFALGNRRLEWKCNNDNARSQKAAERLGFSYEGVFRQHMVVKGKNRDTTWYSMIDSEWPRVGAGFEKWLSAENQLDSGQLHTLVECRV